MAVSIEESHFFSRSRNNDDLVLTEAYRNYKISLYCFMNTLSTIVINMGWYGPVLGYLYNEFKLHIYKNLGWIISQSQVIR